MQRNAIVLSTIVVFAIAGCKNLGGPPRQFANNQPVPSAQSRATTPDLQNSYATDNAKQLRSSLAASPYQAEMNRPDNTPQKPSDNPGIPIVAAGQTARAPTKPAAAQHVCDENCGHSQGVVGPDGIIGLPQFRLSELSDEEKLELVKSDQYPGQQRMVNIVPDDTQNRPITAEVRVTPALPSVESQVTIPVAQPVTMQAAPPASSAAESAPVQLADSSAASSRNAQPVSSDSPQNPAAENQLVANSTFRSQASMQVQVVDEESAAESNPASRNSMPEFQLPPIRGELANALRQQTDPPDLSEPEIIVPPPAAPVEPVVAQSQPEVIPPTATQQQVAAADPASKPASSSGIRVDPNLRNPWTMSQASPPVAPPTTTQPVLRIPAQPQPQRFNAPAEPTRPINKQTPSASDMLVKPASYLEPAELPLLQSDVKTAQCNECRSAVCIHANCSESLDCFCNNSPPAIVMSALGGIPWIMATRAATVRMATAASDATEKFSAPANQQIVLPKPEMRNEARVRTDMDQVSRTEQQQMPPGLQAPVAALTTEIIGFGQYERLASNLFQPGQTILMYCELTGYTALEKQTRQGIEFETILESQLVVTDASGKTVQQDSFPALNDVSRSPRNDFYMYVPFKIGKLAAGNYQVLLQVRDAHGNSSAIAGPIDFSVR